MAGLPFFYLLTFVGTAEESQAEFAALCAGLGVSLWLMVKDYPTLQALCALLPMALFALYSIRVLPGWRVFKLTLRGIGLTDKGQLQPALESFHQALALDPSNELARDSLWTLHRQLDVASLDPQSLGLLDVNMCLQRVAGLLLHTPGPDQMKEAHHLLDLVLAKRTSARSAVDYWRAVAWTHARDLDRAAEALNHLLDPTAWEAEDAYRRTVLFAAWQLALLLHPELKRRVGTPQLELPGRRVEAIAALERRLMENPDDPAAWDLKRFLYGDLREGDLTTSAGLDPDYLNQLGMALVTDPHRWQRGAEFLRMAARVDTAQMPFYFKEIIDAHRRAGDEPGAWQALEASVEAARSAPLTDDARHVHFAHVRQLAERAREQGDVNQAIHFYQLFAESERSGLETRRALADLFEKKGDIGQAILATERALVYEPSDADLLARKDRYYFSISPDHLRSDPESYRKYLDLAYCQRKAKSLLDLRDLEPDMLDWARHLAELASVLEPDSIATKVLHARCERRAGRLDSARALLEEARGMKPERFAGADDEEAWYLCCRLLGDMYLYDLAQPDLAAACYQDFRQSAKSGADTMYKLGQAYEQLGDHKKAVNCYEHVTTFESHPLAPDAREAIDRLKG